MAVLKHRDVSTGAPIMTVVAPKCSDALNNPIPTRFEEKLKLYILEIDQKAK